MIKPVVVITRFPMSPSVNALYAGGADHKRRYPSKAYKEYIREYEYWALANTAFVQAAKEKLKAIDHGKVIFICSTFYFEKHKVLTKAGRPKRNDTSNRIKALDDALSNVFEIDDCVFWNGSYNKVRNPIRTKRIRPRRTHRH